MKVTRNQYFRNHLNNYVVVTQGYIHHHLNNFVAVIQDFSHHLKHVMEKQY
jgi:hypothetical protein